MPFSRCVYFPAMGALRHVSRRGQLHLVVGVYSGIIARLIADLT
jgi:hypothetical protein